MNEFFIRDPFLFVIALNELKYAGRAIQLIFVAPIQGERRWTKKPFMETQREHRRTNRIKWKTANQGAGNQRECG